MGQLTDNANPKHNPITTIFGVIFITIGAVMVVMKYILPAFIVYKESLPFEWYVPIIFVVVGLCLLFMNDEIFNRIFNRVDKVVGKRTDTE